MNKEQLLLVNNENPEFYKDWTIEQVKKLLNWRKKAKISMGDRKQFDVYLPKKK